MHQLEGCSAYTLVLSWPIPIAQEAAIDFAALSTIEISR